MKQKLHQLLLGVLTAVLLLSSAPITVVAEETEPATWPDPPEITSAAAVVIEVSTGAILYNKAAFDALPPASTTKLMTSLLAIEQCPLSDIVTCSKDSVNSIGWDSSRIGLVAGESIDMENALYAILLASANEVSYAVAEHIGGTVDNFVSMMNNRAADLGCVNTNFANPHGLDDPEHYSCPYDLALITRKAIEYTTFRRVSNSYNHHIPPTNKNVERIIANTHPFLKKQRIYDGVFAGKTGSTSLAGNCLVTCAEKDDMTIICAIMNAPNRDTVTKDTIILLDYVFDNFSLTPLAASEAASKNAFPVLFEDEEALISEVTSPLTVSDASLVLPKGAVYSDLTKEITLYPSTAFVAGQNVIGEVAYFFTDNYVGSAKIAFHSEEAVVIQPSPTPVPTVTPIPTVTISDSPTDPDSLAAISPSATNESTNDLRPIIIGIIVGGIVLVVGLYLVIIEIPYQKKKKSYNRKHGYR